MLYYTTLKGQYPTSMAFSAKMNHELKLTNEQQRKTIKHCKPFIIDKIRSQYNEFMRVIYDSLGTGCNAILNIMLDYQSIGLIPSLNENQPVDTLIEINDFDKNAVRRMVHNYWFNKKTPTIEAILNDVNNLLNFKIMSTSLKALFIDMNYELINVDGNSVIMENRDLISLRRKYLLEIQQFRNEGRPIYYLGDTWANSNDYLLNHTCPNIIEEECYKTEYLEGFFILNIGSNEGFLPGVGVICPESKINSADYIANIKGQIIQKWFGNVLPLLKDNAVIVVDNSPHYSVLTQIVPTTSWGKKDIIEWLENKGQNMDYTEMTITDLMVIVDQIKLQCTTYVIDEMAKSSNKTIVRIPPYHCELNPIEFIWSTIKFFVKSNSHKYDQMNLSQLISIAINKITQEHWELFISNVKDEEKMLLELEELISDVLMNEFDLDDSA